MPLILALVALIALKYFEVWKFAGMSWGWVVALAVAAFIWFEFVEKMLGLDKRKAHDENERLRQERVRKNFEKK